MEIDHEHAMVHVNIYISNVVIKSLFKGEGYVEKL